MTACAPSRARVLAIALLGALATVGCVNLQLPLSRQPLVETVIRGESGPKILLIDIQGVIASEPGEASLLWLGREGLVARMREELDRAREDPEIRALLLRIDTPGGEATASDLLYREILRFKQDRGVPVVAQLMGLAASGGYYAAMAADELIAYPTGVVGSIGVVFSNVNVSGLMEKLGVEDQTLVSGRFKDAGSWLRPMRPEERAQLQSVVDDLFARFKRVVAQGRPKLSAAELDRLADGRVYSAPQALEHGLVDRIGDLEDAVARAEARAGLSQSRVVVYHRPREWKTNLYTQAPTPPTLTLRLLPDRPELQGPAFLYLWVPGGF